MNLTNDTILTRVAAAADAIASMPKKELLAFPTAGFVSEYNRTRRAFVELNPTLADAAPPESDDCRYVELLAYYEQLRNLLVDSTTANDLMEADGEPSPPIDV